MNKLFFLPVVLTGLMLFVSCNNDDDDKTPSKKDLTLNLTGLPNLGTGYAYEGWIMVDGSPVTTGTFTVDDNGTLSETTFELDSTNLDNATAFILSIEPSPDTDPNPSDQKLLGGAFSGDTATIAVDHSAALGDDFTTATGKYFLATPTDDDMTNELSGVWFIDNSGAEMEAGLDLPTLPTGWKYEGWAVIDGNPVSTGTFTSVSGMDEASPYSGTTGTTPPFPGEDFLMGMASGITFPVDDLLGATIVVSIEPSPDNSTSPFVLKPLVDMVPDTATSGTLYDMDNNAAATNPTGTVSR